MKKLLATTLICFSLTAPMPAIASSDGERLADAILHAILAEIMLNEAAQWTGSVGEAQCSMLHLIWPCVFFAG